MREVLRYIQHRREIERRENPLLLWVSDRSIPARDRLVRWLPCAAPFVFGFMDLNATILRYPDTEAAANPLKRAINDHLSEDSRHWPWYLHDLQALGVNARLEFAEVLKFLWGLETQQQRLAVYRLCQLATRAEALELRYSFIAALEGIAELLFSCMLPVAAEYRAQTGVELLYFGPRHADREPGHLVGQRDDAEATLQRLPLAEPARAQALALAGEVCDAIASRWREAHAFAGSERHLRFLTRTGGKLD